MAEHWYFQIDGAEYGPFTAAELKTRAGYGQLSPQTLIRKGSSQDWVPASRVKGLFGGDPQAQPLPTAMPSSAGNAERSKSSTNVGPPNGGRPTPILDNGASVAMDVTVKRIALGVAILTAFAVGYVAASLRRGASSEGDQRMTEFAKPADGQRLPTTAPGENGKTSSVQSADEQNQKYKGDKLQDSGSDAAKQTVATVVEPPSMDSVPGNVRKWYEEWRIAHPSDTSDPPAPILAFSGPNIDMQVGYVGQVDYPHIAPILQVRTVLNEEEMVVRVPEEYVDRANHERVMDYVVKGAPVSQYVTGATLRERYFEVSGTRTLSSTNGSTETVFVLKSLSESDFNRRVLRYKAQCLAPPNPNAVPPSAPPTETDPFQLYKKTHAK